MNHDSPLSTSPPLTHEEVAARAKTIIAEEAGMAVEDVRDEHDLFDDLGYDSLMVVESTMEIEDQFDINVPDEAVEKMRTVRNVIDGIHELLGT